MECQLQGLLCLLIPQQLLINQCIILVFIVIEYIEMIYMVISFAINVISIKMEVTMFANLAILIVVLDALIILIVKINKI